MEKEKNYWPGKRAKVEILKEGKKLYFTAEILEFDDESITFVDRDDVTYSFKRGFVNQITELNGGRQ